MVVRKGEQGQVIVLLTIVFLGLLAFVGIATDVAMVYWNRAAARTHLKVFKCKHRRGR